MTESFLEALGHLAGFLIVLVTLAALWGLTLLLGRLVSGRAGAKSGEAMAVPGPGATGAAPEMSQEYHDDLIVVAAAVAEIIDQPHRVVSIRPQASSWGQQGRREIHASHRIR